MRRGTGLGQRVSDTTPSQATSILQFHKKRRPIGDEALYRLPLGNVSAGVRHFRVDPLTAIPMSEASWAKVQLRVPIVSRLVSRALISAGISDDVRIVVVAQLIVRIWLSNASSSGVCLLKRQNVISHMAGNPCRPQTVDQCTSNRAIGFDRHPSAEW